MTDEQIPQAAATAKLKELAQCLRRAQELTQEDRFDEAEAEYAKAIEIDPTHPNGQIGLAKLRYMRGDPLFARDLVAAASANRDNPMLQLQFAYVLRLTGDLSGSELLLRDLIARHGPAPEFRTALSTVLHEAGRLEEAKVEAFAAVKERPDDPLFLENLVAALLALGEADQAMPIIRAERALRPLDYTWIAHEATAARLLEDPVYQKHYDYERLVGVYDLEAPSSFGSMAELNAALEESLKQQHKLERQPFDQSLRAGTQTMGNLLAATDPAIRATLEAFLEPIADYRAKLGRAEDHPLSVRNRGATRLATCWSVQLKAEGFHVNHIHPEGWLSSAYYVSVPGEVDDAEQQSGWIKFGEPPLPVPGAGPDLIVQPRPGRLVLFPSYMWHGTTAIHGAEPRITMAFDVVTDA